MSGTFNPTAFMKSNLTPRTAEVLLPSLITWFDHDKDIEEKDKKATFKVKGLSGHEMALVYQAAEDNKKLDTAATVLANGNTVALAQMRESMGLNATDTPESLVKRLKMLQLGSVEPKFDNITAVKLAQSFPMEFYELTNLITQQTGMGYDVKK